MNTKHKGNAGEDKAANYLAEKGWTIIERNFRSKRAEIDIIALKGQTLAFIEVKTMPAGSPEDIPLLINSTKQGRIISAAKFFLLGNWHYRHCRIRFDAIIVDMPALGPIYHIENAFGEY
ncbi:MAG: YraN family protein [Spirochaetaceae bacterium]|jgi:putative endonuclease|nr:YraN family protein [Spirochaetaceae bacterium]